MTEPDRSAHEEPETPDAAPTPAHGPDTAPAADTTPPSEDTPRDENATPPVSDVPPNDNTAPNDDTAPPDADAPAPENVPAGPGHSAAVDWGSPAAAEPAPPLGPSQPAEGFAFPPYQASPEPSQPSASPETPPPAPPTPPAPSTTTAQMPPVSGPPLGPPPGSQPGTPPGMSPGMPPGPPGQPAPAAGASAGPMPPPGLVSLPAAESRVAYNLLGSLAGIVLVGVGLALLLRFGNEIHGSGAVDFAAFTWTTIGAVLLAVTALLARWASWTPIVPGAILTGISIWAMTTGPDSGVRMIGNATDWAFETGNNLFPYLCASGIGLAIGLPLLLTGIAAVVLRAGMRREINRRLRRH